ncbi:LEA type 2 family protein [Geobacter sp. AOG1]|uniref:LEA type 2 family protein n=1 Tax=Geobacter sp. AOG1 TaxID=1566346 RepID=UPI001CC43FBC|nr:LEA type 2 family protein [Geobacter sp. AOG1]GFE59017.1 WHy domain-containing lipoprotein [Geobacter sp. AOG1]
MKRLLLVPLILLAGCSLFVKNPEVTVKDVSLVGLDSAGATLEVGLDVTNPNPYQISLQGYSYVLQVTSLPLASGAARQTVVFASDKTTNVRIPVKIAYGDLLEILKSRPDPDRIPYRLHAGLDVNLPVGGMMLPIDTNGTFAIPLKYRPATLLQQFSDFLGRVR